MWNSTNSKFKLSSMLITTVGYSFHLVMVTLTNWVGSINFFINGNLATFSLFPVFSSMSFVLVFVLTALVAYRKKPKPQKELTKVLLVAPSFIFFLGILLILLESYYYSLFVEVCSALLTGVGCAGNFLVYQRSFYSFVDKDASVAAIIVVGGTGLAALLYYLVSWLPPLVVIISLIVIFIPGACAAPILRWRSGEWVPLAPPILQSPEKPRYKDAFNSLVMPCISIAFIAFLWKYLRILAVSDESIILINNLGSVGRFFSAVVLIVILVFNKYQIRMDIFYRWALPVVGTAFLLLPFLGWLYNQLLIALIYALFAVASMIAILAFNQVSYFYRISPLVTFGFGYGSFHLVSDIGTSILPAAIGSAFFTDTFQTKTVFALIVLYVVLILFVLSNRIEQKSMISAWNSEKLSMIDRVGNKRKETCKALSEQYGLTVRESEVLEYLALGYRASNIAELIVISENTVNFHLKNIYRKLSIHNKHDLLVLLDGDYDRSKDGAL